MCLKWINENILLKYIFSFMGKIHIYGLVIGTIGLGVKTTKF